MQLVQKVEISKNRFLAKILIFGKNGQKWGFWPKWPKIDFWPKSQKIDFWPKNRNGHNFFLKIVIAKILFPLDIYTFFCVEWRKKRQKQTKPQKVIQLFNILAIFDNEFGQNRDFSGFLTKKLRYLSREKLFSPKTCGNEVFHEITRFGTFLAHLNTFKWVNSSFFLTAVV